MIKKCGILMLSLLVLFVVPANAVQIGSQEESFNLNSDNEIKNIEIKDMLLNNNETADINGTVTNETTDLNSTVGNYTNETFVNSTVGNDTNSTVGNDTNSTVDKEKLKEQKQKLKENIVNTLNNVGVISGVVGGVLMTMSSILITVPDPTWITKVITAGCIVGTAAAAAVSIGCAISSILVQWFM
ncbi:hypothetical protein Metbo_1999 [Methanobacterium lacus]|uniref:Uncharacterized protein n=1 Tax=Methanobacterium lacus (strain AL-21) TaxID=877455 RepID=F0TBE9_METLA|nr:hypothetical protein [Methanobacterium lacus]ADZ10218.1 hypothetical protein Metbo_1999 [Methanobacterium lacus]